MKFSFLRQLNSKLLRGENVDFFMYYAIIHGKKIGYENVYKCLGKILLIIILLTI